MPALWIGYDVTAGDSIVSVPRGRLAEAVRRLLKRYVRVKVCSVYDDPAGKGCIVQLARIFTQPGVDPRWGQW